jgi:hypothetical protein
MFSSDDKATILPSYSPIDFCLPSLLEGGSSTAFTRSARSISLACISLRLFLARMFGVGAGEGVQFRFPRFPRFDFFRATHFLMGELSTAFILLVLSLVRHFVTSNSAIPSLGISHVK